MGEREWTHQKEQRNLLRTVGMDDGRSTRFNLVDQTSIPEVELQEHEPTKLSRGLTSEKLQEERHTDRMEKVTKCQAM